MAVYLVTWDLNKEKPNYDQARNQFLARLDEFSNTKDPKLHSVRFVHTDWTAQQVSEHLRTRMDDNDKLVVTKMAGGNHWGWLNKAVWEWINARL